VRFDRRWLTLTILATTLLAGVAGATDFQGRPFNITPFGGWTFYDQELTGPNGPGLTDNLYYGGRISARLFSPLWLDLAGGLTNKTACAACAEEVRWSHYSANLMLASSAPRLISPFVSVGGGVSEYKPLLTTDKHDGLAEGAVGFKVRITDAIGLRLEGRSLLFVPKKDYFKAHLNNVVAGMGVVFAFGGQSKDSDGDGVPDSRDRCPNTPHGCTVDAHGCPSDADGDGVCDGLDKCPNTPRGATVDEHGCSIDSDGDGVFDGIDKCPDTPRGCEVDAKGCPIDSDGDGVCDGLDRCPNTPTGCKVDQNGCPIDSDGDGVCDGLDKCPNTPVGTPVNANGCSPEAQKHEVEVQKRETELVETGVIRLQDVKFETGRAYIQPESRAAVDAVGEVLSKYPQLQIEIDGHTDSRGPFAANMVLSRRRANAVRTYLLEHYPQLQAGQITTKGYGESKPLMPNTSPANMSQNRRVEFKVLNREVLKQLKP
jgi:outer membrane protein OmpA-like peptidoglycan-associated protein